jgi:regulator of replication initiation timing
MTIHETPTENDTHALQLELDALRKRLNNEIETLAKLRKEYEAECRGLDHRDDANVFAAK